MALSASSSVCGRLRRLFHLFGLSSSSLCSSVASSSSSSSSMSAFTRSKTIISILLPLILLQMPAFTLPITTNDKNNGITTNSSAATAVGSSAQEFLDRTEKDANSTAKTFLPPEPTDVTSVAAAYQQQQQMYSPKELHELMQALNSDIRNGFGKMEEEGARLSEVISQLTNRMDKLEECVAGRNAIVGGKGGGRDEGGWLVSPSAGSGNTGSWSCLLLTVMAILLLAIALLVLCNSLLIRRLVVGGGGNAEGTTMTATTVISGKRGKKGEAGGETGGKHKEKKEQQQQKIMVTAENKDERDAQEMVALVKKAEGAI